MVLRRRHAAPELQPPHILLTLTVGWSELAEVIELAVVIGVFKCRGPAGLSTTLATNHMVQTTLTTVGERPKLLC